MRLQVSELKRDASDPDDDQLMMLEMHMRERITFLRALMHANSFAGLWNNADAELWIAAGSPNMPTRSGLDRANVSHRPYGRSDISAHAGYLNNRRHRIIA